jgi:bifunctional ADP-heptose synthase (sugar kinase/adenylyltransferase)
MAVDPKRKNFFAYKGVDIFKPNLKEAREALNLVELEAGLHGMQQVHRQLHHQLGHHISLVTLSEHGAFYQAGEDAAILPAHIRNIADVSGAGDTVIAVASLVFASTKNARKMAEIANIAGGLVCEEVGTAAVDASKLLAECKALLGS